MSHWSGDVDATDDYYANDGILRNGTQVTAGMKNQALQFDAVDDNVEIPFSPTLISLSFSVEAWVKPLSQVTNGTNQSVIFGQGNGAPQLVVRPGISGVYVSWQFKSTAGPFPDVVSGAEIPIGTFSHVVGTWDGNMLRLYIDGVLDNYSIPGAVPVLTNSCPFNIGGFGDSQGCSGNRQLFNGLIDELKLYDEAIEPARVLSNFQNP